MKLTMSSMIKIVKNRYDERNTGFFGMYHNGSTS